MAQIDIFNDNAFRLVELSAALTKVDYRPGRLGSLGVFTPGSVRTEMVSIEEESQVLSLVQTTPRGAPIEQASQRRRKLRAFRSVRLAKADHLTAAELAGIREFGTDSEFMQVQAETLKRMAALRNDLELTHENMRLGAVQGIVTDADGSALFNWFTEFGIAQPAEMTFDFADLVGGKFRTKCNQIIRAMAKASKGAWSPQTTVHALCGDEFYDKLITNEEVRETYKGWQAAQDLRADAVKAWEAFPFGSITWENYRGTDDGSTVAVPSTKCKFFPVNAPGAFLRVQTPGEFFDTINQPGQDYYALTIPDDKRQAYVDLELYSYPLYVATRPGMLMRAKL